MTRNALFRAIADPTRRDILLALRERPMPVHEIAARFPISRPAISRHLRQLGEAGLVEARREAQANVYALRADGLEEVTDWLSAFWGSRLHMLKRLAEGDS